MAMWRSPRSRRSGRRAPPSSTRGTSIAGVTLAVAGQELREQILDHLRGGTNPKHSGLSNFEGARPRAERLHVG